MIKDDSTKIVRITNISKFDFTPELGAMYGGVPYFVAQGQSLLAPYGVGKHLARALARQIFIKAAPDRTASELDGKGSDRPLWDEISMDAKINEIMSEEFIEERPAVVSPDEIMKEKIQDLNKDLKDEESTEEIEKKDPESYKDKSEVISALKAKDITFDARKSKIELEKLLK